MIGYLKRGEAYRRRDELEAAPARPAAGRRYRPAATRPRELLGDVNYARSRFVPRRRALSRPTSGSTTARRASSTSWRSPATAAASRRVGIDLRSARRSRSTTGSPRRTTCSASASATRSSADAALHVARARRSSSRRRCCRRAKSWPDLYDELGRQPTTPDRAARSAARARPGAVARRDARPRLCRAPARPIARSSRWATRPSGIPTSRYTYVALGRVWLETAQARGDRVELGKALEALEQAVGRRTARRPARR